MCVSVCVCVLYVYWGMHVYWCVCVGGEIWHSRILNCVMGTVEVTDSPHLLFCPPHCLGGQSGPAV